MNYLSPSLTHTRSVSLRPGTDPRPLSTPVLRSLLTKSSSRLRSYGSSKRHLDAEHVSQAATIDVVTTPEPVKEDDATTEDIPYEWFKNWYPLQSEFNLPEDRPTRLQLLDKWFVVWKGKTGEWVVMDDQCPHRFAPLSEGRIEKDGNLMCSYHAWRFDENGKCVNIPHAEDEKAHEVACNSRRSAVQSYPCKTRGGLLWVWPDASPTAFEDCKTKGIMMEEELADHCEAKTLKGDQWYTRVLPYNYDVLMENLLDPSHFIISHHKTFPMLNRYDAKALKMKPAEPLMEGAVAYEHDAVVAIHKHAHVEFRAPVTFILQNSDYKGDPNWIRQHGLITPLSRAKCRAFMYSFTASMIEGSNQKMKSPVLYQMPAWAMHVMFNNIVDGDIVFINLQDRILRRTGRDFVSAKSFYIPSTADSMVMAFRKWFEGPGRQGELWGNATPYDERSDERVEDYLDRYSQHVLECTSCQRALARFQFVIEALKWTTVLALAAAACVLTGTFEGTPMYWKAAIKDKRILTAIGVAVGSAVGNRVLKKLVDIWFFYKPWNHPDNH
eukprot:g359.t1